jgi:putative PIN family toxin of toxin-antitoxin system
MIPRIVMDTNVLFAAMRSRRGASFKLLSLIGYGEFEISLSVPLCFEYEDVAARQERIPAAARRVLLKHVIRSAELHQIRFLWRPLLPDPKDDLLLEVAVQSHASVIVTYNKRHFLAAPQFGIRVLDPLEFLKEIGVLP